MNENDETLEQIPEKGEILRAIEDLSNKLDKLEKSNNIQFESIENQIEVVRSGIVHNDARFDRLESIALDAKSIALQTRSQLTILTEEIHQMKKEPVM